MRGKSGAPLSISSLTGLKWVDGEDIVVDVELTGITQETISFDYKLSSSHTEGSQSDVSLVLSDGVVYDSSDQKITIPSGVRHFSLKIPYVEIMNWIDATLSIAAETITLERLERTPEFICTPTSLTVPDLVIPTIGGMYQYSYRINGGEIITKSENAGGAPAPTVLVNILAHYGFFDDLVTSYFSPEGTTNQKAFVAAYDQPIQGGSLDHPNMITAQSNTIEFLFTPSAEHDLIQTIFGEEITLQSCAIVNWSVSY